MIRALRRGAFVENFRHITAVCSCLFRVNVCSGYFECRRTDHRTVKAHISRVGCGAFESCITSLCLRSLITRSWKRVVVLVSVARDGAPGSFIDCCKPMMLKLSRFVTPTPFRSASQFCQRAYQSRRRAAFWLTTRYFSVISDILLPAN